MSYFSNIILNPCGFLNFSYSGNYKMFIDYEWYGNNCYLQKIKIKEDVSTLGTKGAFYSLTVREKNRHVLIDSTEKAFYS